jgi:hypothetical protein
MQGVILQIGERLGRLEARDAPKPSQTPVTRKRTSPDPT